MQLFIKKYFLIILSVVSVTSFNSCSDDGTVNIFSNEDEVSLGQQLDGEIRSNPAEYPVYKGDPAVKQYLNTRIFRHILTSSAVEKEEVYNYQLEIIDNDSVLNAFAIPGGYIYIYTGLLKYLDSEAAVAGVLAHEIAHDERRHATQRLTKAYGVQFLLGLLLGENPSQISVLVANMFVGLAFLKNSRDNEDESDEYSIKYLQSTRYYPGGVKFFFEKLRDDGLVSENSPQVLTYLSTHPDPIDRIASADMRLKNMGLQVKSYRSTDADLYRDEYRQNVLNRLR